MWPMVTTSWLSYTAIRASSALGAGAEVAQVVTVSSVRLTTAPEFTFDAPALTTFAPSSNLADAVLQSVTVDGLNFGGGEVTATASLLGYQPCSTSSWLSASSVSCGSLYAVQGTQSSGVVLTVGAVAGTRPAVVGFRDLGCRASRAVVWAARSALGRPWRDLIELRPV